MPLSVIRRLLAVGALLLVLRPALGDDAVVEVVVLKEHGVGNQSLAQPYLDRMVAMAARLNGWKGAVGKYFTSRSAAETYIKAQDPHYGILSLPAFLALRKSYQLEVVGQVAVSLAGGRRYYVISKTAKSLDECKGKILATDHADDPRFVDRIVLAGQASLADFTVKQTRRPLQTIKAVVDDQAVCALIDDLQQDQLSHLSDIDGTHTIWESAELPPMPVVAFPSAPPAERAAFKNKLDAVCEDDGKTACAEIGIDDLTSTDAAAYATVVAAYDK